MATNKARELLEELRTVLGGGSTLIDSVLPPLMFVVLNAIFGFTVAMWGSLAVALGIAIFRLLRGQSLGYVAGGLGGVLLAIALAQLLDRAEGYFLPSIVTNALLTLTAFVSALVGRPMVAWTSHITRGWPWKWYWHPRVRPAYTEVTLAWGVFFGLRLALQLALLQQQATGWLAVVQVVMGWPALIVLLVFSYLYGIWRLRKLGGPSVEEFKQGDEPPWEGQQRGF